MTWMRISLALVCMGAAASAQASLVVPNTFEKKEGPGSSEAPGDWTPVHMQCIYNEKYISSGARVVKNLRYRRDGTTAAFSANTRDIELQFANKGVPKPEFSSDIYEGNRGTDQKTVFKGKINFPSSPGSTGPNPFTITFPMNSPFLFAGKGNILIEIVVKGATFRSEKWRVDATAGLVVKPTGTASNVGQGCPTTFNLRPRANAPWPGALMQFTGSPGVTSQLPYLAVLGVRPLSIDLTAAGMPNCKLLQDILVAFAGATRTNGALFMDFGRVPPDSRLQGATFRLQTFVVDASFNKAGLRASASLFVSLGQGFPKDLDAHAWYDRRNNTGGLFTQADWRSTRTPIFEFN